MNVVLIKQSTCSNLGVGSMMVLNSQGVEREVCVKYSPAEANKKAAMEKGYGPGPEDLIVVERSFVRDEQNNLVVEKTTKTPLSVYFELFDYVLPETKRCDTRVLFDNELIGACY